MTDSTPAGKEGGPHSNILIYTVLLSQCVRVSLQLVQKRCALCHADKNLADSCTMLNCQQRLSFGKAWCSTYSDAVGAVVVAAASKARRLISDVLQADANF